MAAAGVGPSMEYHELNVHYLPELTEEEKSKSEYSVHGIQIKDLIAQKSTFSKEEIRWMIDALENCKIHAMGIAKLTTGGVSQGFCGAAVVSERNMQGVMVHFIRCIDLNAFTPIMANMLEQQIYPGLNVGVISRNTLSFPCAGRLCYLQFRDDHECDKFTQKYQGCLSSVNRGTGSKIVSKIFTDQKGTEDPKLMATIRAAEQARGQVQPVKGAFLAEGLADIIEQARSESSKANEEREKRLQKFKGLQSAPNMGTPGTSGRGRGGPPNNRGRGGPPGSRGRGNPHLQIGGPTRSPTITTDVRPGIQTILGQPEFQSNRLTRAETLQPVNPEVSDARIMPRESKIMAWRQEINRPTAADQCDIIVKIQLVKLGGTKTMKFKGATLIGDAVRRLSRNCNVNPEQYGLFRRSGLRLVDDASFASQGVAQNDFLEFKLV